MNLMNNIILYRKKNELTQEQLAEKCSVSRQAVAKWENGESIPDLYKLILLSEIFHISLDELVLGRTLHNEKVTIAREIYELFADNFESLRISLNNEVKPNIKLAAMLRSKIRKSRLFFSQEQVDKLLDLAHDFGLRGLRIRIPEKYDYYNVLINLCNQENIDFYCNTVIPDRYNQLQDILNEYLNFPQ